MKKIFFLAGNRSRKTGDLIGLNLFFLQSMLWCLVAGSSLYAQPAKTFNVKVNETGATVQPTMWGIFF